jgi:transcription elongation factor Elf1
LGRRRRKTVKIVRKKLPKFFRCPSCENESISIDIRKNEKHATVACASCGLIEEMDLENLLPPIDIYCRFIDKFYSMP